MILLSHLNPVYLRFGVGVLLVLYTVYGLARPAIKPMKIGFGADIGIGIVNGLVGGLTGLGGIVSTISCQWRGWTKDLQRAVFQPVLFAAFVVISISMGITGAFTSETLKLYALGFPFMLAGLWSGFKLYGTIDDETFRMAVLIRFRLSSIADARVAQLLAAGLGGGEGFLGPLCDPVTLFLGHGCVNVQHEGINIRSQFSNDEWDALHHEAADEVNITAQSVQLGDDNRSRACFAAFAELAGVLHGSREFRSPLQRIRAFDVSTSRYSASIL